MSNRTTLHYPQGIWLSLLILDIGTVRHCALVSCILSQSIGLFWVCAVLVLSVISCSFTNSLIACYFIIMVATIIGIFVHWYSLWPAHLGCLKLGCFCSATTHLLGCFCSWNFSLNIGLNIFYRGCATDCPYGVWGHGLTTCFLYVGLLVGSLVWNDRGFVIMFVLVYFHIIFTSEILVYCLQSTLVLFFYIDVVLTLSVWIYCCVPASLWYLLLGVVDICNCVGYNVDRHCYFNNWTCLLVSNGWLLYAWTTWMHKIDITWHMAQLRFSRDAGVLQQEYISYPSSSILKPLCTFYWYSKNKRVALQVNASPACIICCW